MRRGISLVSVLVAIGVIGFLIALILPAIHDSRKGPNYRSWCSNNLKQIALAMHNYHDTFNELPPGGIGSIRAYTLFASTSPGSASNDGMWGWAAIILPQVEQQNVATRLQLERRSVNCVLNDASANRELLDTNIATYLCPLDDGRESGWPTVRKLRIFGAVAPVTVARSSYAVCMGASELPGQPNPRSGAFAPNSQRTFKHITDGLAHTILVGERASRPQSPAEDGRSAVWLGYTSASAHDDDGLSAVMGSTSCRMFDGNGGEAQPDLNLPTMAYSSNHWDRGAQFAMADGSTRSISRTINFSTADQTNPPSGPPGIYNRLGMIADGHEVDQPY